MKKSYSTVAFIFLLIPKLIISCENGQPPSSAVARLAASDGGRRADHVVHAQDATGLPDDPNVLTVKPLKIHCDHEDLLKKLEEAEHALGIQTDDSANNGKEHLLRSNVPLMGSGAPARQEPRSNAVPIMVSGGFALAGAAVFAALYLKGGAYKGADITDTLNGSVSGSSMLSSLSTPVKWALGLATVTAAGTATAFIGVSIKNSILAKSNRRIDAVNGRVELLEQQLKEANNRAVAHFEATGNTIKAVAIQQKNVVENLQEVRAALEKQNDLLVIDRKITEELQRKLNKIIAILKR